MALPSSVGFFEITGKFIIGTGDGSDPDRDPDAIPAAGLQFVFTPNLKPPIVKIPSHKITATIDPVTAATDASGVLVGPDGLPGVRLIASDDPDVIPNGWTWSVTVSGGGFPTARTTFVASAGESRDFSEIVEVPESPGNAAQIWEAVASQAVSAAVEAAEAKDAAVAAAGSVRRDAPGGVAPLDSAKRVPDVNLPARLTEANLSATIADMAAAIDAPGHLDIWDSVASMTEDYPTFISQLDSQVGSAATKETVGYGSGAGARPIYHYAAGTGVKHVLLIGGQHGFEVYGSFAAREYFVKFATSSDPSQVALRRSITLHFLPVAVPHAFARGRSNGNGVDINRNYEWNWARFTASDKGAAPLDQPETQVIKALLDNHPIELVVDCHSMEASADDLQTATAGPMIHNKRSVAERAVAMFQLANPDAPAPLYYTLGKINPSLRNWAQKYLRFDKKRPAAQTVLIECRAQLGDSPAGTYNRQGMRWYASLIHHHILAWLQFGQVDEQIPNYTWIGSLNASAAGGTNAIEITEGGRRISSATYEAAKFLVTSGESNRDSIVVPIRHPGRYVAHVKVNLENLGTGTIRVLGGLAFLPDSTGNITPTISTVSSRRLASGEIGVLDLMGSWNFLSVPADTLYELQVLLRVEAAGQVALVRENAGLNVQMTVSPAFEPYELPVPN